MILYETKTRFLVLYCLVSPFLIRWQNEEWEDVVQSCIPPVIVCSPKDKNSLLLRYPLYRLQQVKKSKTTEHRTVRHLLISTLQYYRTKPVQSVDTNRQQSGHSELLTDYHHRVYSKKIHIMEETHIYFTVTLFGSNLPPPLLFSLSVIILSSLAVFPVKICCLKGTVAWDGFLA
jgi:hypothetical protein